MTTSVALAIVMSVLLQPPAEEGVYENLKVLPHDISPSELNQAMLENLRGLGLRRLAGEGCLLCHVGDLETPRTEWDYASDAKPMKEKARVMMAMTKAINEKFLGTLETRVDPSFRVTCMTCHTGRTDPRPLVDVLWSTYEADGIDGASEKYRNLRERYLGSKAYDFRDHILPGLALYMANQGKIDDAIELMALNVEANPESASARRKWISLRLERIVGEKGVEEALAELDRMEPTLDPGVVTPAVLDLVAWRLNRTDRQAQGHALIEANLAKFLEEYIPHESMAFILSSTDRKEEAFALLEKWIEIHPDHDRAKRLLINLRAR